MEKRPHRYRCPWCNEFRTREEMRGRVGGTGPVPSTCQRCRSDNPELSWCKYHQAAHPRDDFPCRQGRGPEAMCHRASYELYEAPGMKICPWCGERKTPADMKGHPPGTRGKAPTTCHDCRTTHPDESWCTFHQAPHSAIEFDRKKTGALDSWCKLARHEDRYGHVPLVECPSCKVAQPSGMFSGRGHKKPTCRTCNESHPGMKWCRTCSGWREVALWPQESIRSGSRCSACYSASRHNTTVADVLRAQGVDEPQCESCGGIEKLCIDHDHGCCPGTLSCGKCVLGYLCWRCNSAEGQLVTSERAFALAEHMVRREKKIAAMR